MTIKRLIYVIAIVMVAMSTFVGGVYFGRWAVKNRVSPLVRQYLAANNGWMSLNTHLVRLEFAKLTLPNAEGWGGGVKAIDNKRMLYATGHGQFGVLGVDGSVAVLPIQVDMGLDPLKKHPVWQASNFNPNWFRVTDIDLAHTGSADRHELLIGHHHFDATKGCVELWLSQAVLEVRADSVSVATQPRRIVATEPCITFAGPKEASEAFNGWSSGGRILRSSSDGKVLFSTGDHKWNGLNGYPALSQLDNSTLGKILIVDLKNSTTRIFAKGLRNPQGLAVDSEGRIWGTEHGPRGGDELNLITEGANFGWPDATYGTDYGPRPWPHNAEQGRHSAGAAPIFSWTPSIGTSSLIQVSGAEFSLWKGDLLVLSLANQSMHRLRLVGDRVVYDEPITFDGHRLRDITQFPDGRLAILTDEAKVILLQNGDRQAAPYLNAGRQLRRSSTMSAAERERAVAGGYRTAEAGLAVATDSHDSTHSPGYHVFVTRCAGCHPLSNGAPGIAPDLAGLVGRRVGSTSFAYSTALSRIDLAWTALDAVAFATAPASVFPGTRMSAVQLTPDEQAQLRAFLERLR